MREKLTVATSIIVLILIIVILVLSYNLNSLNATLEAMKSDKVTQNNLEDQNTSIENRVSNLEIEMGNQNLNQFVKSTKLELNRIEDLLSKVDGLETVYGTITGLDQLREVILNVELADTQQNVQIKLAEDCTPYMMTEIALAPIDTEEFLKLIEEDLKNGFPQGFTFKIVNGKAVQIYQGWGSYTKVHEEEKTKVPSIEGVRDAYGRAYEAFTWFELTTMPFESTTKEVDNWVYYKIEHNTIKKYIDLENHLCSLFSQEIVEKLLNKDFKRYRDIDGELYGIIADRGTDIYKGDATMEVQQESDVKFTCIVEVELLDDDNTVTGYETHEFSYELIDDKWVFTKFYLYY